VVDEISLSHVDGHFAIWRALFENFEIINHFEALTVFLANEKLFTVYFFTVDRILN
jgi:hypothetical protein